MYIKTTWQTIIKDKECTRNCLNTSAILNIYKCIYNTNCFCNNEIPQCVDVSKSLTKSELDRLNVSIPLIYRIIWPSVLITIFKFRTQDVVVTFGKQIQQVARHSGKSVNNCKGNV